MGSHWNHYKSSSSSALELKSKAKNDNLNSPKQTGIVPTHRRLCPLRIVFALFIFLLHLISSSRADILIVSPLNKTVEFIDNVELAFGALPFEGISGKVALSEPEDACEDIKRAPNDEDTWFLLAKRYPCTFETKVRNAAKAGFKAVIIYSVDPNKKSYYANQKIQYNLDIPTVLISYLDGEKIKQQYLYDKGYNIYITKESRVHAPARPLKRLVRQANALDQLVSFLTTYANQQSAQQAGQAGPRPPALPLGGGAGMVRAPPQQQQPQQQAPPQTSTPVNPFANPQFQSARRGMAPTQQQQQQQLPNQNNNQLFLPSSPATPYLTLNRIASLSGQQQPQQQPAQSRPGFNIKPINTIPLGANMQQPNGNVGSRQLGPNRLMPQLRPAQVPQVGPQQAQMQQRPNLQPQQRRPSLAMPPLPPVGNGANMKPISGFAPSGPPPSQAANSALVVVQSPANAIGQAQSQPGSGLPQQTQTTPDPVASSQPSRIETNNEPISTLVSSTGAAAATPDPSADKQAETSSLEPVSVQPPSEMPAQTLDVRPPPPAAISESASNASTQKGDSEEDGTKVTNATGSPARDQSSWNPLESGGNRSATGEPQPSARPKVSLAPSPDIVTVPPGYNPDAPVPQHYDIAVSAQMGEPAGHGQLGIVQRPAQASSTARTGATMSEAPGSTSTMMAKAASRSVSNDNNNEQSQLTSEPAATTPTSSAPEIMAAPTATTTILWSPPVSGTESQLLSSSSLIQPTPSLEPRLSTPTQIPHTAATPPRPSGGLGGSRIRDNSLASDSSNESASEKQKSEEPSVVYGKAQARDSKPVAPPLLLGPPSPVQANIETSVAGRPFIQPVQMDNQVRPFPAGASTSGNGQQSVLKSNHGPGGLGGRENSLASQVPGPFRGSRPFGSGLQQSSGPMHVGSGFTITATGNQTMPTGDIQDYVAGQPPLLGSGQGGFQMGASGGQTSGQDLINHEPTISAQGAQDPATMDLDSPPGPKSGTNERSEPPNLPAGVSSTPAPPAPRIRRPTFKPKPAEPPIRIDSCIVGDDSSCDQSHNERCVTEYGISSCHCKPGYARLSQLRGYCSPVSTLQLSFKINGLSDDRRLAYNHTLGNSSSEEYQYLEFETIQALAGAFQQTQLAKQFMGTRVNKFFGRQNRVWANVSVLFEANNLTKSDRIRDLAVQELIRVIQAKPSRPPGDSTVMLDGSKESMSKLVDVDECANPSLNDCSKYATCTNSFGGFQCHCQPGYEDKYQAEDKAKHGRVCLGCSPSYCSNRGECSIVDGQKHCKCRPNFIGARCDIDSEVLAVAIGGSLVGIIILIITFWCLFVFNRRWKREQQKMDAMSATSGLTFNYVNSASTNSLMSPLAAVSSSAARQLVGGLHRSGGHQVGAMAANYGQRFGGAGARGGAGGHSHYAPDQQAIIGSTSSGSSASSSQALNVPCGGNPYAPAGYQYDEAAAGASGLLIAPASTGSSEQTSPSGNSYRGIMLGNSQQLAAAGSAYTLSGHHHHHHHRPSAHHHHHHHPNKTHAHHQLSQFHPAANADYRTLNTGSLHCPQAGGQYDAHWRTLQQDGAKQSALVGYYLSPDMLVGHQTSHMQQMYNSPQRELCIDTGELGARSAGKQKGRAATGAQFQATLRSRSQMNGPRNPMYHSSNYEQERPI